MVGQKHLDWTLLRIKPQAKLFLHRGEDGWTRNIRPWIRSAGPSEQFAYSLVLDAVGSRVAGIETV